MLGVMVMAIADDPGLVSYLAQKLGGDDLTIKDVL